MKGKSSLFELIRFAITGGLATFVDLGVSALLVYKTSLHENFITSIAFIVAFWVSYFGHRYFTFKKRGNPFSFFVLAITTLIIRNVIVFLLVLADIRGLVALVIACFVVTAITYCVAKYKIFTK